MQPASAVEPAIAPTARILLVEDDRLQADSLAYLLRQEGYAVDVATTGTDGLAMARAVPAPDVVLVDVGLPELSGVEVTRRLRAGSRVPIILLTARRQEMDKVIGLDAGADDYVTKPFGTQELLARVRAQLRRHEQDQQPGDARAGVYEVGELRIDTGVHRVTLHGQQVDLSAREFGIVRVLAEAAGRVVQRQQLFASVWGPGFFGDERALDVYMRELRKKIEPEPSRPVYLHTVRGVGFRLAYEPDTASHP